MEGECVRREALLVKDKEALDHLLRATASEVQVLEEMVANGATTGKARRVCMCVCTHVCMYVCICARISLNRH